VILNPVTQLPSGYNNGVVIDFSSSNNSTAAVSASGTLTFGFNPASVGSNVVALSNSDGTFSSTYTSNGTPSTFSSSFIDTGSNAIFFSPTNSPTLCSDAPFYCPNGTVSGFATIGLANGIALDIGNFDAMNPNNTKAYLPQLAGPGSSPDAIRFHSFSTGAIDWGLPFFFGRKVFLAIQGQGAIANSIPAPFISF
jgi:hypothetical protein